MKQQIADFLGELAEEMGWQPPVAEPRIKPPTAAPGRGPATATRSSRPAALEGRNGLQAEVLSLRRTVDHLSTEITHLRAQIARLRNLPVPPDATDEPEAEPGAWVDVSPPVADDDLTRAAAAAPAVDSFPPPPALPVPVAHAPVPERSPTPSMSDAPDRFASPDDDSALGLFPSEPSPLGGPDR